MAFSASTVGSYNGFTFDDKTETVAFSAKPKYDQSGRTVAHVVYSITLKIIILGASATSDTEMLNARRRLLKPGQAFSYANNGSGGLTINVTQASRDVAWGPKPLELSYKPIGTKAAELVWRVDVAIPECSTAVYSGAIMEFNYRLAIDIDRSGWSTRTYRGYYVVPLTRRLNGGRSLEDSADNYWENVIPDVPIGFRREITSHELDESKARAEFTIIDSEMGPNMLPPGVTDCRASHSLESMERGFQSWFGTITAEYDCARDFSPERTYQHFTALVKQRIDYMRANSAALPASGTAPPVKGDVFPIKLTLAEPDIYGRPQAKYSVQFLFTQPVENILKSSGLWLPTGNDWNAWKASLQNSGLHPRGNAKLKFNSNDDVIVDLCINRDDIAIDTEIRLRNATPTRNLRTIAGPCPSPNNSWISYDLRIQAESEDHVLVHKTLPTIQAVGSAQAGFAAIVQGSADIVQRRVSNSDSFIVYGSALRVCYDIPAPRLKSISGRAVIPANRHNHEFFDTGLAGNFDGHALVWAVWRLRYIVPIKAGQQPLGNVNLNAIGTPTMTRELATGGTNGGQWSLGMFLNALFNNPAIG